MTAPVTNNTMTRIHANALQRFRVPVGLDEHSGVNQTAGGCRASPARNDIRSVRRAVPGPVPAVLGRHRPAFFAQEGHNSHGVLDCATNPFFHMAIASSLDMIIEYILIAGPSETYPIETSRRNSSAV